jgi:lambda family phage tail tape measure protein
LTGFIGGLFGNADGNAFINGKVQKYAYGGVVNKPTIFPMANGMGLMGEAGAEAILPLSRGANGKLGVQAQGGGIGNIVVNVDASGSSVEGDQNAGQQLGRLIGAAVQSELIQQRRPGGLLA